jgi:SAM-dependent methyltransferase
MPTYDDELLAPHETLIGYDRWAPTYDYDPNALVSATSWVLDRAPLGVADADVLELGCGTGRNVTRILGEGARSYLGLDGSHGMLSVAADRHRDPRCLFGKVDLMGPWSLQKQYDFALIVLVLEHLPNLDPMFLSLARAIRPGGRIRIIDLHPERIAAGSFAHFQDGTRSVHFASVAHSVSMLCVALDVVGFETVRRDWLAGETMQAEVPGLAAYRGSRLVLDIKATRRSRDRRGSSAP